MPKRRRLSLALLSALVLAGLTGAGAALASPARPALAAATGTRVPGAPECPMFPADNVWNTPITTLPVDPRSRAWLASMGSADTNLHPDFGPTFDPSQPYYGIPFTVIGPHQGFVRLHFEYASESDRGPYPFGPDTPIEGGQHASGDRHAIMVDPRTCTLYELYDAVWHPGGGSTAGSGAIWHLTSNALRPATWTSADAAGLPILPGLLDWEEVRSGHVDHAIRMTAEQTDTAFIWPARHEAGARDDPSLPPMGARFRLEASFPVKRYPPLVQVVLRAMQTYGLILADNGSNWYFQGVAENWPLWFVDDLKTIPASAFQAVDERSLIVD